MRKSIIRILSILLGMVIICFTILKITDVISTNNSNQINETNENMDEGASLATATSSQINGLGYYERNYSINIFDSGATVHYYSSGTSYQTIYSTSSVSVYSLRNSTTVYFYRYAGAANGGSTSYSQWKFASIYSITDAASYPGSVSGGFQDGSLVGSSKLTLNYAGCFVIANTTLDIAKITFNINSAGYITMSPAGFSTSTPYYVNSSGGIQTTQPSTPAVATYYSLNVSTSNSSYGTVTSTVTQATAGTTVSAIATPKSSNYQFGYWLNGSTGQIASTKATYTFSMPANSLNLIAIFSLKSKTLTTSAVMVDSSGKYLGTGGGSVTSGGSQNYDTEKSLYATAYTGYTFVGFSTTNTTSGVVSSTSPYNYKYNASSPTIIYALFRPVTTTLTTKSVTLQGTTELSNVTGGTVTSGASSYYNSTKLLEAKANTGYEFVCFSTSKSVSDSVSTYTTYTYKYGLTNQEIYAIFRPKTTTLTTSAVIVDSSDSELGAGGGSVTVGGSGYYGSKVTLTATPATGYEFVCFSTTKTASGSLATTKTYSYTYDLTNKTIYAVFRPVTYKITVKTTGLKTSQESKDVSAIYNESTSLSQTKTGYTITNYTLTNYVSGGQYSLNGSTWINITGTTLPAGTRYVRNLSSTKGSTVILTCNYSRNSYSRSVTSNNTNFGTAQIEYNSKVAGSFNVLYTDSYTLVAIPKTGYQFDGWYNSSGQLISGGSSARLVISEASNDSTSAISYTARFSQKGIHVSSSYNDSESNLQCNTLKVAIEYALKHGISNIYIDGEIGSLYKNYNTFVNEVGNYIKYNSTSTLTITGLGTQNIIYNNSANCMIDVISGHIIFENVTIYGTGSNKIAGNRDNALLRVSGSEASLTLINSIITNSYNIGSGIHFVGDWCPGVIDVYSGTVTLDSTILTGNTTTYGGDIFLHGGSLIMENGSSIIGSVCSGIYAVKDSSIEIKDNSSAKTVYLGSASTISISDLRNSLDLYKEGAMSLNSTVGTVDSSSSANYVLGVSGTTNLKGSASGTKLVWTNNTTTVSKLEAAILDASGKYTITLGESISLASALGKYVYHVSGCLSIGNVKVVDNKAIVTGTGKRAVITGTEVGVISVTLSNIKTRGCYYYGTTTITKELTIKINVLPRIGDVVAGNSSIGISNCTPNAQYQLIDSNGNVISKVESTLDSATGEYCVYFGSTNPLTNYTIKVTSGIVSNEEKVTTSNKHALVLAIENSSGFYMNLGEKTSLTSILGRTVRHLSGCINVSNVKVTTNSSYVTLSSNTKNATIEATRVGYVDIELDVRTNGWCAVYGTVSTAQKASIRLYILPALTTTPTIAATSISNLPSEYEYSLDGITYTKVTHFTGLTQNTLYKLYIRYTDSNNESLVGTYNFTTKLSTSNPTTIKEGLTNKVTSIKKQINDMNLSSDTYDNLVEILDKYQNYIDSTTISKDQANKINEALDTLFSETQKVESLDITSESSTITTTNFEEYLNNVLDKATIDITSVTTTINSNANFVENVEKNRENISNITINAGATVEDYKNIIDIYESLTNEEQTALLEDLNNSVLINNLQTQINFAINSLSNLSSAEKKKYTDKITSLSSTIDIYNEYIKASIQDDLNAAAKEYGTVNSDGIITNEDLVGLVDKILNLKCDDTTSNVTKQATDIYNEALVVINKLHLDALATENDVTPLTSYQVSTITNNKYGSTTYPTYKEAFDAAILADEITIMTSKVKDLYETYVILLNGTNISSESKESLRKNIDAIEKTALESVKNATSLSELEDIISELKASIALETIKTNSIKDIETKTKTALNKYSTYDDNIKTSLVSSVNSASKTAIDNILTDSSKASVESDEKVFANQLEIIDIKSDYLVDLNSTYQNILSTIGESLLNEYNLAFTNGVNEIISNATTLEDAYKKLSSVKDVLEYIQEKQENKTKINDALTEVKNYKDAAKEETSSYYDTKIEEQYGSLELTLKGLSIEDLDEEALNKLVNDTKNSIDLLVTKDNQLDLVNSYKELIANQIDNLYDFGDENKFLADLEGSLTTAKSNIDIIATTTNDVITAKNEFYTSADKIYDSALKTANAIKNFIESYDKLYSESIDENIKEELADDVVPIINKIIADPTIDITSDISTLTSKINAIDTFLDTYNNLYVTNSVNSENTTIIKDILKTNVSTIINNIKSNPNTQVDVNALEDAIKASDTYLNTYNGFYNNITDAKHKEIIKESLDPIAIFIVEVIKDNPSTDTSEVLNAFEVEIKNADELLTANDTYNTYLNNNAIDDKYLLDEVAEKTLNKIFNTGSGEVAKIPAYVQEFNNIVTALKETISKETNSITKIEKLADVLIETEKAEFIETYTNKIVEAVSIAIEDYKKNPSSISTISNTLDTKLESIIALATKNSSSNTESEPSTTFEEEKTKVNSTISSIEAELESITILNNVIEKISDYEELKNAISNSNDKESLDLAYKNLMFEITGQTYDIVKSLYVNELTNAKTMVTYDPYELILDSFIYYYGNNKLTLSLLEDFYEQFLTIVAGYEILNSLDNTLTYTAINELITTINSSDDTVDKRVNTLIQDLLNAIFTKDESIIAVVKQDLTDWGSHYPNYSSQEPNKFVTSLTDVLLKENITLVQNDIIIKNKLNELISRLESTFTSISEVKTKLDSWSNDSAMYADNMKLYGEILEAITSNLKENSDAAANVIGNLLEEIINSDNLSIESLDNLIDYITNAESLDQFSNGDLRTNILSKLDEAILKFEETIISYNNMLLNKVTNKEVYNKLIDYKNGLTDNSYTLNDYINAIDILAQVEELITKQNSFNSSVDSLKDKVEALETIASDLRTPLIQEIINKYHEITESKLSTFDAYNSNINSINDSLENIDTELKKIVETSITNTNIKDIVDTAINDVTKDLVETIKVINNAILTDTNILNYENDVEVLFDEKITSTQVEEIVEVFNNNQSVEASSLTELLKSKELEIAKVIAGNSLEKYADNIDYTGVVTNKINEATTIEELVLKYTNDKTLIDEKLQAIDNINTTIDELKDKVDSTTIEELNTTVNTITGTTITTKAELDLLIIDFDGNVNKIKDELFSNEINEELKPSITILDKVLADGYKTQIDELISAKKDTTAILGTVANATIDQNKIVVLINGILSGSTLLTDLQKENILKSVQQMVTLPQNATYDDILSYVDMVEDLVSMKIIKDESSYMIESLPYLSQSEKQDKISSIIDPNTSNVLEEYINTADSVITDAIAINNANGETLSSKKDGLKSQLEALKLSSDKYPNIYSKEEKTYNSYNSQIDSIINAFYTNPSVVFTEIDNNYNNAKAQIESIIEKADALETLYEKLAQSISDAITSLKGEIAGIEGYPGDLFNDILKTIDNNFTTSKITTPSALEEAIATIEKSIQTKIDEYETLKGLKTNATSNVNNSLNDAIKDLDSYTNISDKLNEINKTEVETLVNDFIKSLDSITAKDKLETAISDVKSKITAVVLAAKNFNDKYQEILDDYNLSGDKIEELFNDKFDDSLNINFDIYKQKLESILTSGIEKLSDEDIDTFDELKSIHQEISSNIQSLVAAATSVSNAYKELDTEAKKVLDNLKNKEEATDTDREKITSQVQAVLDNFKLITDASEVETSKAESLGILDSINTQVETIELNSQRQQATNTLNGIINGVKADTMSLDTYINHASAFNDILANLDNISFTKDLNSAKTPGAIIDVVNNFTATIQKVMDYTNKLDEIYKMYDKVSDNISELDLVDECIVHIETAEKDLAEMKNLNTAYDTAVAGIQKVLEDALKYELDSTKIDNKLFHSQDKEELLAVINRIDLINSTLNDNFTVTDNTTSITDTLKGIVADIIKDLSLDTYLSDSFYLDAILDQTHFTVTSVGEIKQNIENNIATIKGNLVSSLTNLNFDSAKTNQEKLLDLVDIYNSLAVDLGYIPTAYGNAALEPLNDQNIILITALKTAIDNNNTGAISTIISNIGKVNDLYNSSIESDGLAIKDIMVNAAIDSISDVIEEYAETIDNNDKLSSSDLTTMKTKNDNLVNSYKGLVNSLTTTLYNDKKYDTYLVDVFETSTIESFNSIIEAYEDGKTVEFIKESFEIYLDTFQSDLNKYNTLVSNENKVDYMNNLVVQLTSGFIADTLESLELIEQIGTYEEHSSIYDTIINNVVIKYEKELDTCTTTDELLSTVKNNQKYIQNTIEFANNIDRIYTHYESISEDLEIVQIKAECDILLNDAINEAIISDYSKLSTIENKMLTSIKENILARRDLELSDINDQSMINQAKTEDDIKNVIKFFVSVDELLSDEFDITTTQGLVKILLENKLDNVIKDVNPNTVDDALVFINTLFEQTEFDCGYTIDDVKSQLEDQINTLFTGFNDNIENDKYDEAITSFNEINKLINCYNIVAESLDFEPKNYDNLIIPTILDKNSELNVKLADYLDEDNKNEVLKLIDQFGKLHQLYNSGSNINSNKDYTQDKTLLSNIDIVEEYILALTESLINNTTNDNLDSYVSKNDLYVDTYQKLTEILNQGSFADIRVEDKYDTYVVDTLTDDIDDMYSGLISYVDTFVEKELSNEVNADITEFKTFVEKYDAFVSSNDDNYITYTSDLESDLVDLINQHATTTTDAIFDGSSDEESYDSYYTANLIYEEFVTTTVYDPLVHDKLIDNIDAKHEIIINSGLYHDDKLQTALDSYNTFLDTLTDVEPTLTYNSLTYVELKAAYDLVNDILVNLPTSYDEAMETLNNLETSIIDSSKYEQVELDKIEQLINDFIVNENQSSTKVDLVLQDALDTIASLPTHADKVTDELNQRKEQLINSNLYNDEQENTINDLINEALEEINKEESINSTIDKILVDLIVNLDEVKTASELAVERIEEIIADLTLNHKDEYLPTSFENIIDNANEAIKTLEESPLTSDVVESLLTDIIFNIESVETIDELSFNKVKAELLDSLEQYKDTGYANVDTIVDNYYNELSSMNPKDEATKDSVIDKYNEAIENILETYQEELLSDIEEVDTTISLDDYYTEEQEKISAIIKDYKDNLEKTTKADDLKNYIDSLNAKLNDVSTKLEVEINKGKDSLNTMLNEALASTNPDGTANLSLEQKKELADYVEELKNNITGSTLEEVSLSIDSENNSFITKLEGLKNDFIINNINDLIDEFTSMNSSSESYESLKGNITELINSVTGDKTNLKEDEFNLHIMKNEALIELDEYLESLEEYSNYNQEIIADLINQAITDLNSSTSVSDVSSIITSLATEIDTIPTKIEEELSSAKENAKNYLDKFINGSDSVLEVINTLKNQIDGLSDANVDDIEKIVSEGVTTIYETIIKDIIDDYNDSSANSIFNQALEQLKDCENLNEYNNVIADLSELLSVRDQALNELNDYYDNGLNLSSETKQLILDAIKSVEEKTTIDSISTSLNYHTNLIDKQILADEKVKAINEINNHYSNFDSNDYTIENYNELTSIKNQAVTDIKNAMNLTVLFRTKDNAISSMNDILTIVGQGQEILDDIINDSSSDAVKNLVDIWKEELRDLTPNSEGKYNYNDTVYDNITDVVNAMVDSATTAIYEQEKEDAILNAISIVTDYKDNLVQTDRYSTDKVNELNNSVLDAITSYRNLNKESYDVKGFIEQVNLITDATLRNMREITSEFTTTKDEMISRDTVEIDYPENYDINTGLWGNVKTSDSILSIETTLVVEKQKETYLALAQNTLKEAIVDLSNEQKESLFNDTSVDLSKTEVKELLDIYLIENNKRVVTAADGSVSYTVRILIPEAYRGVRELSVVHIKDDGTLEVFSAAKDGNFLVFTTTHFSDYALIGMTPLEQAREETSELVLDMLKELEQTGSIYTHDQWTSIKEIYTETLKQLQAGTIDAPEMERIVIQLQELVNEVPTEIEQSIEDALTNLEEEFNSYNPSDYPEEEYQKIVDAYNQAKEEILAATTVEEVESIKEEAKSKFTNTVTVLDIVRNVIFGIIIGILGIFLILFLFYFKVIIYDFEDEVVYSKRTFFLLKVKANKLSAIKEGYILEGIYFDKDYKDRVEDFRMPFGRAKLYANLVLNLEEYKFKKLDTKEETITNSFTKEVLNTPVTKVKEEVKESLKSKKSYNFEEEYDDSEDLEFDLKQKEFTEAAKDKVILKDYNVLVNYSMSFEAKLALGEDELRDYYNQIKNKILSYQVKARMSFKKESFYLGRKNLIVLNSRGKTLKAYIALSYDYCLEKKVRAFEANEKFALENNLTLVKVSSNLQLKKFIDLIDDLMTQNEIGVNEDYKDKDYTLQYLNLTKEKLIEMGKIKVYQSKSYKNVNVYEVNNLMSDEELANVEIIEEETFEIKGQKGIINIDTVSAQFNDGDIVNLETLKEKKLIGKNVGYVKVLARGTLDKSLTIKANAFSKDAMKMIILTGGKVVLTVKEN